MLTMATIQNAVRFGVALCIYAASLVVTLAANGITKLMLIAACIVTDV